MGESYKMLKIIDNTKPLDLDLCIHEKVLWPCYEYAINIKGLPFGNKNIFEKLLLTLLLLNDVKTPEQLSEDSGLEIDFVMFLLDRLIQKNMITKDYQNITAEGKAFLSEKSEKKSYKFYVYVDSMTGKLIPNIEDISSRKFLQFDDGEEHRFSFKYRDLGSSAGEEEKRKKSFYRFDDEGKYKDFKPEVKDVYKVVKNSNIPGIFSCVPDITIAQNEPTVVYKVIDVVLQTENQKDFYFSNGKGNLSPFFTNAFNNNASEKNQEVLQKFREKLKKQNEKLENDEKKKKNKEKWLHPELFKLNTKLNKIISIINQFKNEDNDKIITSTSDNEKRAKNLKTVIKEMYSFTEQVIGYICNHNSIPMNLCLEKIEKMTSGIKDSRNLVKSYLVKIARNEGFNIPENMESLFAVKPGRIEFIINKKTEPDMFTICGICLILSDINSNYWFKDIGQNYPDFFEKIRAFKHFRDKAEHENSIDNVSSSEVVEFWEYIKNIFKNRIKGLKSESASDDFQSDDSILENNVSNVIGKMEEDLGFPLKTSIGRYEKLFSIMEDIETYSMEENNINSGIIISIYQLLEQCFEKLKNSIPVSSEKGNCIEKYKNYWRANSGNSDLSFFEKIDKEKVQLEIEGKSISLQTAFIAWITLEDYSMLEKFGKEFENMVEIVQDISDLRGHGEIPDDDIILKTGKRRGFGTVNSTLMEYKKFGVKMLRFMGENGYFS